MLQPMSEPSPRCDCKKQCVDRFMEHPERASLLEMWREQMRIRTLHEQNQQLLHLVKRVKGETQSSEASPCVGWACLGCSFCLSAAEL